MAVDVPSEQHPAPRTDRDVVRIAATGTAAALAVAALAFGLWQVRSVVILLLLALTFAAAIRPGVEWLERRRVPAPGAIFAFFALALGGVALFCWLAVPPPLHHIGRALNETNITGAAGPSTGARERALVWLQ